MNYTESSETVLRLAALSQKLITPNKKLGEVVKKKSFTVKLLCLAIAVAMLFSISACKLKKNEKKIKFKEVWKKFTQLPDRKVYAVACYGKRVWVATKKGLVTVSKDEDKIKFPADASVVLKASDPVLNLKIYNNILYMATLNGLVTFDQQNEKWRRYKQAGNIRDIAVTDNNKIWVSRKWGAAKYNGSQWSDVNSKTVDIVGDDINCLEVTGDTLWIGTNTGVSQVTKENFKNITGYHKVAKGSMIIKEKGNSELIGNRVLCFAGKKEDIWIGTSLGLSNRNSNGWTTYTADHMEPGRTGKYEPVNGNSPLVGNSIRCLVFDSNENLFIGTSKGLSILGFDKKWTSHTAEEGKLPGREVTSIAIEGDDIWVGTNSGLALRCLVPEE